MDRERPDGDGDGKGLVERVTGFARDADKRFAVTMAGADGRTTTLSLSASAVSELFERLVLLGAEDGAGAVPTRLPESFAVGVGKHEPLVLVRFEDEAPYALKPSDARDLAEALLECADDAEEQPEPARH
jgi:hypothetical protein